MIDPVLAWFTTIEHILVWFNIILAWFIIVTMIYLFNLYMPPMSQIMKKNHSSADDTQLYLALSPNDYSPIDSLCQCIDEVNNWMCQNFLHLNKDKIEVIAFETKMKFSMWMHTFTVGV